MNKFHQEIHEPKFAFSLTISEMLFPPLPESIRKMLSSLYYTPCSHCVRGQKTQKAKKTNKGIGPRHTDFKTAEPPYLPLIRALCAGCRPPDPSPTEAECSAVASSTPPSIEPDLRAEGTLNQKSSRASRGLEPLRAARVRRVFHTG